MRVSCGPHRRDRSRRQRSRCPVPAVRARFARPPPEATWGRSSPGHTAVRMSSTRRSRRRSSVSGSNSGALAMSSAFRLTSSRMSMSPLRHLGQRRFRPARRGDEGAKTPEDLCCQVEELLVLRLRDAREAHPAIAGAVRVLAETKAPIAVTAVVRASGLSARHSR